MRLHDLDDARLKDIRDRGGIEVDGLFQGFAAIEMATPELAPAVDGADIIVVCTGSNAHAEVARLLAPRLRDGQTILLVQGGTGGSLVVRNALGRHGCRGRRRRVRDGQLPLLARVAAADVHELHDQEGVAADRRAARRARRGGRGEAPRRVPAGRGGAEHPLHRPQQCQRHPARRQHGVQYRPARIGGQWLPLLRGRLYAERHHRAAARLRRAPRRRAGPRRDACRASTSGSSRPTGSAATPSPRRSTASPSRRPAHTSGRRRPGR